MAKLSNDVLSVSGLLWIHELLPSKHRGPSKRYSSPFACTF